MAAGVPWERRRELGPITAFFITVRESLLRPVELFRRVHPGGGVGPALVYAIIAGAVTFLFGVLWDVVLPTPWPWLQGIEAQRANAWTTLWALAFAAVGIPILVPLGVLFVSLVYHGLLLLFGGPSRGFEGTLKGVAYASGVQLLNVVPLCGWIFALVWGLVVQVVALREIHGLETGKAAAIVIVPYVLCVVFVLATIVFVLLAFSGQIGDLLRDIR